MNTQVPIVINACYGGFSISRAAVLRGRELSGNPKWGGPIYNEAYPDGSRVDTEYDAYGRELERTDPILVAVVTELGDKANGMCAKLRIRHLDKGEPYSIDDYDGFESLDTPAAVYDRMGRWKRA